MSLDYTYATCLGSGYVSTHTDGVELTRVWGKTNKYMVLALVVVVTTAGAQAAFGFDIADSTPTAIQTFTAIGTAAAGTMSVMRVSDANVTRDANTQVLFRMKTTDATAQYYWKAYGTMTFV